MNLIYTCKYNNLSMIEVSETDTCILDRIQTLMECNMALLSFLMEDSADYSMSIHKTRKNFDLIIDGIRKLGSIFEDKDIIAMFFECYEMLYVSKNLLAELKHKEVCLMHFNKLLQERLFDENLDELEKKAINNLKDLI